MRSEVMNIPGGVVIAHGRKKVYAKKIDGKPVFWEAEVHEDQPPSTHKPVEDLDEDEGYVEMSPKVSQLGSVRELL